MKLPKSMQFEVYPNDDDEARTYINIIEYLEYEPAMYIHEDGYFCESLDGSTEYFVAMDGRVDRKEFGNPEWEMGWAVQRTLRMEADLMEAAMPDESGA